MLTLSGRRYALDQSDISHLSLHSDWPGTTGANEASGGSYDRATDGGVAYDPADANGIAEISASVTHSVTGEIRFVGAFNAGAAGDFRACWPMGGTWQRFTVDPATDVFTLIGHGWSDGQTIVFGGDAAPGGLTLGTVYYIRDATTDTFKVTDTTGPLGAAIDITAVPASSPARVSNIEISTGSTRPIEITSAAIDLEA